MAIAGALYFVYHKGEVRIQTKWDADKVKVAKEIADLKEKQGQVTVVEVIKYVDRVKVVEGKTRTITAYVDKYITTESDKACVIPNNAITIIDAAARNTPLPAEIKQEAVRQMQFKPIPLTGTPK